MDSESIRRLAAAGRFTLSRHAERERRADMILVAEMEAALTNCDMIEDYPSDPRGPSCLVLGFAGERPIHAVCALKQDPEEVFLITLYDPSRRPEEWTDQFRRRRR